MEIKSLLTKQICWAFIQVIFCAYAITGGVFYYLHRHLGADGKLDHWGYFGLFTMIGAAIVYILFWFIGIIGAIKVNRATTEGQVLIVFATAPLPFIHFIIACYFKKKLSNIQKKGPRFERQVYDNRIVKLRKDYLDGKMSTRIFEFRLHNLLQQKPYSTAIYNATSLQSTNQNTTVQAIPFDKVMVPSHRKHITLRPGAAEGNKVIRPQMVVKPKPKVRISPPSKIAPKVKKTSTKKTPSNK